MQNKISYKKYSFVKEKIFKLFNNTLKQYTICTWNNKFDLESV